jgi:hypothetical protein
MTQAPALLPGPSLARRGERARVWSTFLSLHPRLSGEGFHIKTCHPLLQLVGSKVPSLMNGPLIYLESSEFLNEAKPIYSNTLYCCLFLSSEIHAYVRTKEIC